MLNEAALLTARSNAHLIDNRAVDEAVDRVMAGPQKKTRLMNDHERKVTAYHEGGHALVAAGLNHSSPVSKVTILPRGRALGYTMVVPDEDKYSVTPTNCWTSWPMPWAAVWPKRSSSTIHQLVVPVT